MGMTSSGVDDVTRFVKVNLRVEKCDELGEGLFAAITTLKSL